MEKIGVELCSVDIAPIFNPLVQDTAGQRFLAWELKELLLLVMYILQSGNCPRIAKAGVYLGKNCPPGALHNIDLITDMVQQLASSHPTLVTKWLYVLVLLERCPLPVWARHRIYIHKIGNVKLPRYDKSEHCILVRNWFLIAVSYISAGYLGLEMPLVLSYFLVSSTVLDLK